MPVPVLLALLVSAFFARRLWKRRRLQKRDPQLLQLFAKLEADERRGRLS